MNPEPSANWPSIAAAIATDALLPDGTADVLRRLLRGLMTLHGLRGALLGRRSPGGEAIESLAHVGNPEGAEPPIGALGPWAMAKADLGFPEDPRSHGLMEIREATSEGVEGFLLLAGARESKSARIEGDAREALRLALRIDEARRRREAEQEQRNRLASIIEATGAGTWEWHVPSGRARMNPGWASLIGRDLEELGPLTVDTWIASVHPEDLPGCIQRLEDHLSGRSDHYEAIYRLRHRDGFWLWVRDRGRIVRYTSDGRPEWVVGSHTDITPLKHSEAKLESANEALRTHGALLSAAGRLALVGAWTYQPGDPGPIWSDVVCMIHEVEPGHVPTLEEAIGYYTQESRPLIEAAVRRGLEDGTPWDIELEITTAKGRRRWVRAQGEAEHVDGRVVRVLGAFQDITERRAMQDALLATNADLEERVARRTRELASAKQLAEDASRAKDEFLTNISHELRSPLHSILGFTGLVLDDLPNMDIPTLRRFVEKSRSSASELLKLVNDLLDAAKIESGRLVIQAEPCDLADLVSDVAGEFEVAIRNKGLTFAIRCADGLALDADPVRLAQAIRNVLGNAIRFSPQGGTVRIEAYRPRDRVLGLVVEDDGPGIPEDELEAVFDRFTQSSRTKTGAGGTGLGLPIARGILELHGGHLWAERTATGGSAFRFELPSA